MKTLGIVMLALVGLTSLDVWAQGDTGGDDTASPDAESDDENTSEKTAKQAPHEQEDSQRDDSGQDAAARVAKEQAVALSELRAELAKLQQSQAALREEMDALKRKQAETPAVIPAPADVAPQKLPLEPTASVAMRYDNLFPADPTGQFQSDPHVDGFRMRVRAGVRHGHPDAAVVGEVRLALGQPLNPAQGYVPIGDAFRVAPIGLDRFWASYRPFDDRQVLRITAGKMPNPFWRGARTRTRSELLWDDDVNPTGIALDIKFIEQGGVVVDNTAAYFVLQDIEDVRFVGLTGPISLIADQVRVRWKYLTGAFAFYDYENLNAGMSAPNLSATGGSVQMAANAFLMREGLQRTNRRVSYGQGANGFEKDAFRIINPTLEGHIPLPLDDIGKNSQLFMMADYSHNLSVESNRHGIGGTAGIRTGDHRGGWIAPLSFWFTYRLVEADAALATFTDSNLGQGSDFRGFEIGANYEATDQVMLSAGYFDYLGAPRQESQVRRFFVDVRWDY